ncbi:MAG: hypothetical protein AAFZ87_02310 [Planctomycetota bacterium]
MDAHGESTQPEVRLALADGTTELGMLLSADATDLTVVLPPGNRLGLVEGSRLALGLAIADPESDTPAVVDSVDDREDLGVFATLDLVSRGQLARMQVGTLRDLLNQREVFRTPVQAGTVGRTWVTGLDATGGNLSGKPREAFLVDASFEGVGLLVGAKTDEALQGSAMVRVKVDPVTLPGARKVRPLLVVLGTVRHRSSAIRGVRLGMAAGGPGIRWEPKNENELREFVLEQQRGALARRRRAV